MRDIQDRVKERGSDIVLWAIDKANPDRSFEDPKTVANLDLSKLSDIQKAAYYIDLQKARNLNNFLGDKYADNLFATNKTTGEKKGQPGAHGFNKYPDDVVQEDIEARIKKLEDEGMSQILGNVLNDNVGSYLRETDQVGYGNLQYALDKSLFGINGDETSGSAKYKNQSLVDALTGLNTTTALARTFLAPDDFTKKAGEVSRTYHDVMQIQLTKSSDKMVDYDMRTRESKPTAPPRDATDAEFKQWFDSLTEDSASKQIQPIVQESFNQSEVATKLKEAGVQEGSDVWNEYKSTFAKDVTLSYNNYWGNIRKGVKMDVVISQANMPDGKNLLTGKTVVPGVDADMFRAGAFHTVQTATLSAALAGSIIAGKDGAGLDDPKTAMTLTYAATNLADMVAETASKYLDPQHGAFKKVGLNKDGKWTESAAKYLPGGDFKKIEAAGKMLAGAGSVVFGAVATWKTVDAIKDGDVPAAVFNGLNAAGSTVAGVALGAEGVLQWTNIAKNIASVIRPAGTTPAIVDAAARGVLARVGWGAGLVAGVGLTALGIYDMAKGVKVLDNSMKDANKKYIAPTTGWEYEFLMGPKL